MYNKTLKISINLSVIIVLIAIALGFVMKLLEQFFLLETTKAYFVELIAAILGAGGSIVGVIFTIKYYKEKDKKETIIDNKPEIYVPFQKDINNAVSVKFLEKDNKHTIPSIKFYLKNTTKAPFEIKRMIVGDKQYIPNTPSFIEKDRSFSISFNHTSKTLDSVIIIRACDDSVYKFTVEICDNKVVKMGDLERC